MGKRNREAPSDYFKQKHRKNKQNKTVLVFDEKLRTEYLTGFRKRKEKRRKQALEEEIEKLKEEKRRVRKQKRDAHMAELSALGIRPDVQSLADPAVYDLPGHTVTVTDVADLDFVGRTGFMLGINQGEENETEERSEEMTTRGSTSLQSRKHSKKEKSSLKKKKEPGKKHKNMTHLMDVKRKVRKREKKLPKGLKVKVQRRKNKTNN